MDVQRLDLLKQQKQAQHELEDALRMCKVDGKEGRPSSYPSTGPAASFNTRHAPLSLFLAEKADGDGW